MNDRTITIGDHHMVITPVEQGAHGIVYMVSHDFYGAWAYMQDSEGATMSWTSEDEARDAAYRWARAWENWRRSFHWGV